MDPRLPKYYNSNTVLQAMAAQTGTGDDGWWGRWCILLICKYDGLKKKITAHS
uniref:Uncharacterized protein n=1 Tax=Octopus bimaculoides TaxID=37653 RepID=A0A0L8GDN2_OCTBM